MKLLSSKTFVFLATLIFTAIILFRFMTIQSMNVDDENFYLHHVNGNKLFSVVNDNNNTIVEIYDNRRVKIHGFYSKVGNVYSVYPYSTINIKDINDSNMSMTYRFMADSSKNSFSYYINRYHTYEIVGGIEKNPNNTTRQQHLARMYDGDEPLLAIFPSQEGRKRFRHNSDELYVVALQDNLVYVDKNGTIHPLEKVTKKELNGIKFNKLQKIEKGGFVRSVANSQRSSVLLGIELKDATRSEKLRGSKEYYEKKTKKLTITEYTNFQNIKSLVFSHGNKALYVEKPRWDLENLDAAPQKYLRVPYEIPIDKKIVVKGRDALFEFNKYTNNADFAKSVPRLDNPVTLKKNENVRRARYMDYLDIDNMFGIYVSDENAQIWYSTDKQEWSKAIQNYKYAPPLYLYDPKVKGQFVAPEALKDYDKKIYYKVKSSLPKYKIAFHGKVEVANTKGRVLNSATLTHRKTLTIKEHEVIIGTQKTEADPCGKLLTLDSRENLTYKFRDGTRRKFNILRVGNKYEYRIKEALSPFKTHKVTVMSGKSVYKVYDKFEPQLSCRYRVNKKREPIPSLYDEENYLKLVQKPKRRNVVKTAMNMPKKSSTKNNKINPDIPRELIPIYGDGERFGLLSHGLTEKELTIDKDFSMKVAEIYERYAKSAMKSKKIIPLLNKYPDEYIEGATVVIKIDEDKNREILAMFSYPYPESNDTDRELIIDTLNNKTSTIKNRALDMLVAPGSTFKIVTSIALAQYGMLEDIPEIKGKSNLEDVLFDGNPKWKLGFSLKNSSNHVSSSADFRHAFAASYNTYFGYAGLKLHKRISKNYTQDLHPVLLNEAEKEEEFSLMKVANQLYFNKTIELSSEHKIKASSSIFPTTFTRAQDVADSSIGQYEVRATPLHMAMIASIIYDGKLMIPNIVKSEKPQNIDSGSIEERDKTLIKSIQEFFGKDTNLEKIQNAMKDVVEKSYGTADGKFREFFKFYDKKVKIYAKTGTSQTAKKGLYDGWFVTFTKGLKEDLVIATVLRNSGYGSKYAAPINRDIIKAWIAKTEPNLVNRNKKKRNP